MKMSKRMATLLITQKHWTPYIKSHWLSLSKGKAGYIIGFKGHTLEFECSQQVGHELLELAKGGEI